MKVPEQLNEMSKSGVETTLRFAKVYMESAERLVQLQLEAAKRSMEESAKSAEALLAAKSLQEVTVLRAQMTEATVEAALKFSSDMYGVASGAQIELSKLMEERLAAFNASMAGSLEKAAQGAPGGVGSRACRDPLQHRRDLGGVRAHGEGGQAGGGVHRCGRQGRERRHARRGEENHPAGRQVMFRPGGAPWP